MSRFDKFYRRILLPKIFVKGWGNPSLIHKIIDSHKLVSKRESCKNLIKSFDIKMEKSVSYSTSTVVEGSFLSPFADVVPGSMEGNNQVAKFLLIIPKKWPTKYRPLCIHYAATGDQNYSRRKFLLANRLLKDGIASLIHMNPFYGNRRPSDQKGSSLNYLSDLFVMGGALILEANVLLQWASQEGFGPLAIHGISMGGHMASLGASVYPEPVCLIPCLSWTTASHAFLEGSLSQAVSWDVLSQQYNSDDVFSGSIRAAIEPPVPYHLQHCERKLPPDDSGPPRLNSPLKPDTGILQQPNVLDSNSRKLHILSPLSGNQNTFRTFSSGESSNDDKRGDASSIRNGLNYVQRLRPIDLTSVVRFFNDNKVAKEEIENLVQNSNNSVNDSKFRGLFSKKKVTVDKGTLSFMRDILDYFTHLGNYSVPMDTRLVTIVVAENDAYIPIDGVAHFSDVWDDRCEVDVLKGVGHIEAYVRNNSVWTDDKFRLAIVRTLNRYVELYHHEPGPFGLTKA